MKRLKRAKRMTKSLVYFQSGGPTAVINSSLYGVIKEAQKQTGIAEIFGARYGIEGLIDDNLVSFKGLSPERLSLLKKMPGAALGSSRRKLSEDFADPFYAKILSSIEKHNIGYLLVNGGNDSMDTAEKLSCFFAEKAMDVKTIGIPKTIDNDLALTDHAIGYPSAALHVIRNTAMIIDDAKAYKKGKIVLVEVMGRDTGWLTASTDLLPELRRPDYIAVPEMGWDEEAFLHDIQKAYEEKGYAVAALSEGMPIAHTNDCGVDAFGHRPLEGACLALGHIIDEKLQIPNRTIELSIPSRSDPYSQSPVDVKEAISAGVFAVKSALKGETGKMVAIQRLSSKPYSAKLVLVPVKDVADTTIYLPKAYIKDAHHFSDKFHEYLEPLLGKNPLFGNEPFI
jgi:6-phosphofructokinase